MKKNVPDGSHENMVPQFSIKELLQISDLEVCPFSYEELLHKRSVTLRRNTLKEGCIAIITWFKNDDGDYEQAKNSRYIAISDAISANAAIVVSEFPIPDSPIPVALLKGFNSKTAWSEINHRIRIKYCPLTIAITGNAGKTTTKDLVSIVMASEYNTLYVKKNYNTWRTVGEEVQNLTDAHEIYVQEVHEVDSRECSYMIMPDAVLITNIGKAHLEDFDDSIDVIKEETFHVMDYLKKGGTVFLNQECPVLADSKLEDYHVIRYGVNADHLDYWAENIQYELDHTVFEIFGRKGEREKVVLHIPGIHNVVNAVGAFAVGRWKGIDAKNIVAAMSEYRTSGIRQNMIKVNDIIVMADCYSMTPLSAEAAARTLQMLPLAEGSFRYLVLGYLPRLGNASAKVHREVVERLIAYEKIDEFLFYRKDAKIMQEYFVTKGKIAKYFEYHSDLIAYLKTKVKAGDAVVFKSGTAAHLEHVANEVFGTDFVPENQMEFDREENGGSY